MDGAVAVSPGGAWLRDPSPRLFEIIRDPPLIDGWTARKYNLFLSIGIRQWNPEYQENHKTHPLL
jgi:hypothetical protein